MIHNQIKGEFSTTTERDFEFYDKLPQEFRDYLKYNWVNSSAENLLKEGITKLGKNGTWSKIKQRNAIRNHQYKRRIESGEPWK